jgi:leucyl aminopeptidase
VQAAGFKAAEHTSCIVPDSDGNVAMVLSGFSAMPNLWTLAHLPTTLPDGAYEIVSLPEGADVNALALGVKLARYRFDAHKSKPAAALAKVTFPAKQMDAAWVDAVADAIAMGREMINQPANIMGPIGLHEAAEKVAKKHNAAFTAIVGDELLKQNYPTIHTVGRAASEAPRLLDIRWGKEDAPKVTLVGKGVTFDTGGLDIKSGSNMKLMKKDMGGAAAVLALADMIMSLKLPVRLRVLIGAVENSIAGNAMRPLDIVKTRKGITVEITDTDAEGRLVLCDALAEADSESPEIIVDCATLTGASRVALGADMPSFFTDDEDFAAALQLSSRSQHDPLWRLPLWEPYREMLHSNAADMVNTPDSSYGGAITAALYLKSFVEKAKTWVHIDMMAWNLSKRPGRPQGGEVMGMRAVLEVLTARYGK